ncbi:MAG: EsaB/YukD family protein, partial [Stackebrandtia sp.]
MAYTADGLCKVTIVSPHTRMDVALPSHIPLAELQAELLEQAAASPEGEYFVTDGVAAGGWTLARLGHAPLDPDLSCAQLAIADGEELYFRKAGDSAPAAVFDDVVDAVATAAANRSGPWRNSTTRHIGLIAAAGAIGVAVWTATTVGNAAAATGVLMA